MLRGAWTEAEAAFGAVLAADECPEAFEGIATAYRYLAREAGAFESAERAYRLYRDRGDRAAAARVAMSLAVDAVEWRGQWAVMDGWMETARRLLESLPPTAELGWWEHYQGYLALISANDTARAIAHSRTAEAIAHEVQAADLAMLTRALQGLALVSAGEIPEGMRMLDASAAAAVAGDIVDPDARGSACCYLIDACSRIRDFDRAGQWGPRMRDLAAAIGIPVFFDVCRPNYASVLIWRGEWEEAERELLSSVANLEVARRPMAVESFVRLAELRVRQGRLDEGRVLFERAAGDNLVQLGLAMLATSEGEAAVAIGHCERYLRRMPMHARAERAAGLELLVPALILAGDVSAARDAQEELGRLSAQLGTAAFRGAADYCCALVCEAEGDTARARRHFEDAADTFARSGGRYPAARARAALARVHAAEGRHDAVSEAIAAGRELRAVGAAAEAEEVAILLAKLVHQQGAAKHPVDGLSTRESEVLGLLARGMSNQQIADVLVLSVRTVERHISNIYLKFGLSGPSARVVAAAQASPPTRGRG